MLRVTKTQQAKLSDASIRRFTSQATARLERHFPKLHERRGPAETQALVLVALERARALGMTRERDVARYIDLVYARGLDFAERPGAEDLRIQLSDSSKAGSWRMNNVHDQIAASTPRS